MEHKEEEKLYGGREGPDPVYITLVASDDHEFIIKRKTAVQFSGLIKTMLEEYKNAKNVQHYDTIRLEFDIPSYVLRRMCEYFNHKMSYIRFPAASTPAFEIPPKLAFGLLEAGIILES